jgi:hypothetical protein
MKASQSVGSGVAALWMLGFVIGVGRLPTAPITEFVNRAIMKP